MKEIIANKSMYLKGVVGLFPANCTDDGEDVLIYASEEDREAGKTLDKFCMLRQQAEKESDGKLEYRLELISLLMSISSLLFLHP